MSNYKHFKRFCNNKCSFKDLSVSLCEKYSKFLFKENGWRSNVKLKHNTAVAYQNAFLSIVELAYKDGILQNNIAAEVLRILWNHDTKKEYLEESEIRMLEDVDFSGHIFVKHAALLSIYTGLRRADIIGLEWKNISLRYKNMSTISLIGEPEISLPHNNYDILVLLPGKYAVVIVNNVYGSELEFKKIVNSFKKDIDNTVAPDNIWIIVINKNDDGKSGVDDGTEFHYEFWSYRQEYLSWLRGLRIDNEEVPLRSAIDQYINFLENDLGIVNQGERLQMAIFVMQALGYIPYETTSQTYQLLQEANRLLSVIPIAQKILIDSVKKSFMRLSSKVLTETFPNKNILQEDGTKKKYYRQRMEGWPTYIYLQWEPFTWETLLKRGKLKLTLHINQSDKGLWEYLKKNGYDALFVNGCCEHTEYSDTAFCDMNENARVEILLRCYKPFIPVLNVVYDYLLKFR